MRDIKFRAWDKKNKVMLDNVGFQYTDVGLLIKPEIGMIFVGSEEERSSHYEGRYGTDHELMQYTGLKDKNGKEIYEGDILRRAKDGDNYHFYIVVEYKNGSFGGSTRPGFNHYLRANEWGSCDSDGGGYDEVIGNIHENPELLEVKK